MKKIKRLILTVSAAVTMTTGISGCSMNGDGSVDGSIEIGFETFKYRCNECGHEWTGIVTFVCTNPDCQSPSIEIIGNGDY